ncbi:MAG: hypothetical protein ACHQAY_25925 [Hyphomicrobiales bacterium]
MCGRLCGRLNYPLFGWVFAELRGEKNVPPPRRPIKEIAAAFRSAGCGPVPEFRKPHGGSNPAGWASLELGSMERLFLSNGIPRRFYLPGFCSRGRCARRSVFLRPCKCGLKAAGLREHNLVVDEPRRFILPKVCHGAVRLVVDVPSVNDQARDRWGDDFALADFDGRPW